MMTFILNVIKKKCEIILGWVEVNIKPAFNRNYKYVIEKIETKENGSDVISSIRYKLVGCRKIIADYLCVSRRTVEDYVNKLKIKFSVRNKYELISTAIQLGYLNAIPDRFQNKKI